jgi:hypothetical protein
LRHLTLRIFECYFSLKEIIRVSLHYFAGLA